MAGLIAYDKPVRDFIAGLDATGHVTHTQHRKTKVTLHHNGGRLSLQGILDVWKTRPASAHFQVDGQGALGQYVRVNEYAWATGTTRGNQESISIEMANATMAPDYLVAEITMMEAGRLAGWLFAKVIGAPPTRENLVVHKHWKATLCAGPCIDQNYNRILEQAQLSYLFFTGGGAAPAPAPTGGVVWGSGKSVEMVAREVLRGSWGNGQDRVNRLRVAGYDPDLVQRTVNALVSGAPLPQAPPPPTPARKSVSQLADEVLRGEWGNGTDRARRLQAAGYSATEVQAEVNRRLGGAASAPTRLSLTAIAQQVIQQQWGNGNERRRRLAAAGYDYAAVQAEVNRLLR